MAGTVSDADLRATRLFTTHRHALLRFVRRYLDDPHRGEDLVQETLLRAWLHADQLRQDDRAVQAWLFRVARNIVIDELRYRRARPAALAADPGAQLSVPDDSDAVLNRIDIGRALARLRPEHRSVLVEVLLHDRSTNETADVLRIPHGTVRSRLHYGLKHLRAALV